MKTQIQHYFTVLSVIFITLFSFSSKAQEAKVSFGATSIAQNEVFTISITLQNEQLKTYSNFPDIPTFQKRGVSSQSSTNIVNGQITFSQSIIQNYLPTKQGKFKLKPFVMEINGKRIEVPSVEIKVGPPRQQQQMADPFEEFFGRGTANNNREYLDIKEDAFFALTSTKDRVYVGEGFTITLAFYVSETNRAEMQFYDLQNQMQGLLKKIKPANCWEENYGIDEIQPEKVVIDGKRFDEYKLYRATLYPINKEPINFAALPLKMIKYKVARVQSFFGTNKKEDFKTFNTKPKTIFVQELPPHPLRDNVSVGQFQLEEGIQGNKKPKTGKSLNYNFKIVGEGNISSIRNPQVVENENFEIYPPNIYESINRNGLAVNGSKNFNYFIIPKEPGSFKLNNLIFWVYFNPKTAKYDTLKPKFNLEVSGESSKNLAVSSSSDNSEWLDLIDNYKNDFINSKKDEYIKLVSNIFLLVLLLLTVLVIVRK